jgi:hypothetical protein
MTLHKNRTQICPVSYGDNGLGHMCPDSRGSGRVRGFFLLRWVASLWPHSDIRYDATSGETAEGATDL